MTHMDEVSSDLRTLADMELPPRSDKLGRHVVKFTILCFVIAFISSLSVVTFALFASLGRESDLKTEIGCVRQSAVILDEKVTLAIAAVIDDETTILEALHAFAAGDEATLQEKLEGVPDLAVAGETAKTELDDAVDARKKAVANC